MTLNEYQKQCVAAEPKYLTRGDEAILGLLGMKSAAGTCADIYKKTLYEGRELDCEGFSEALGDIIYFVSILANSIDYRLEDILKTNVEKLRAMDMDSVQDAGDKKS